MSGPIRSDLPISTGTRQTIPGDDGATILAEGSYRGESVQLKNTSSLIQDALEELGASQSERQEKELAKRDIEEGTKSDQLDRIFKIKNLEELSNQLKDLNKRDLARVLGQLMRMKNATPRQLREHVRESFKEPAHQFAALSALVEGLREQGAPKFQRDAAQTALQQLLDEEGPAIRAGINITETAAEFSNGSLGDIQILRDTYRDAVLDYQGLADAFSALNEQYGVEELPHAIEYMLDALGADLAAGGSSIDKSKLNIIRDDMYRLQVLAGLIEECDLLMEKLRVKGAFSGQ
ncbi:MAG: type III secretion system gatekeeper subunit SctW [Candidatus Competibacteraceae bacterium]|nr:type III secretion system gatekeeper subunit SctW [Candidatus Competibacteraceae bacterium]